MAAFHANKKHQISHSKLDLQTLYLKQLAFCNFKNIQIGRVSCTHVNIHPYILKPTFDNFNYFNYHFNVV